MRERYSSRRFSGMPQHSLRIVLPILVMLSLIAPFVMPINGYDHVSHLIWIRSFPDLLRKGIEIPRWLPDSFGGLGSPAFYFYPPLAYYLAALFPFVSDAAIYNAVGMLATWASFLTFLFFLRTIHVALKKTIVPALIFALAPYRFFDLYTRNGFAEHVGFLFVPLLFAGLIGVLKEKLSNKYLALLIFSWSCILLSNIPLAVVTSLGALPVLWFMRPKKAPLAAILICVIGFLLGTVLDAYYLLPIIHFKEVIHLDYIFGLFGPSEPTYFIRCLLTGANTTYGVVGLIDTSVALIVLTVCIKSYGSNSDSNNLDFGEKFHKNALPQTVAWLFAAILFLGIPYITVPLWHHVFFLKLIQFTYRFNILILLFGCTIAAVLDWEKRPSLGWALLLWCALGVCFVGLNDAGIHLHPPTVGSTSYDPAEYTPIYSHLSSAQAVQFVEAHEKDNYVQASPTFDASEQLTVRRRADGGAQFDCDLSVEHQLILHTYFWPQWTLFLPQNIGVCRPMPDGRLSIILPAGKYHAELRLVKSNAEILGNSISIASFILICCSLFVTIYLRGRTTVRE